MIRAILYRFAVGVLSVEAGHGMPLNSFAVQLGLCVQDHCAISLDQYLCNIDILNIRPSRNIQCAARAGPGAGGLSGNGANEGWTKSSGSSA